MKWDKFIFLFIIVILSISCEEALRVTPENSLTYENAYENEKDIETGVRTIESYIRNWVATNSVYSPVTYGELSDYHSAWDAALLLDDMRYYSQQWWCYYYIIAVANMPLLHIDHVKMSQERSDFYKGQIYFSKAFTYFELIRRWAYCPIIYDEVETTPKKYSSWVEVADYAIMLAQEAVRLLPEYTDLKDSYGNPIPYKSTPSKGAANALLAHLCAWKAGCKYMVLPEENNYDENLLWKMVDAACTAIIDRNDIYELARTPEEVCTSVLVGNSRESIYETTLRGFWNELEMISQASTYFHSGRFYQTWPIVINEGAGNIQYMDNRVLVETVRKMFPTRIEGGEEVTDLRRDAYFYKLDSMAKEPLSVTGGYAYPWKYRNARVGVSGWEAGRFQNFDQNKVWFRLADIILLRAESRARLGNTSGAITDLNRIRERAKAKRYEATEYNGDLRYAIYKEREKELFMEGCRWFDVLRNGYYKTELYGGFRDVSIQDILDGVFFQAVAEQEFRDNPLARQNTYWQKRK